MTAPTREDFDRGITRMVANHPVMPSAQARYDAATSAMEQAGFTAHELRGMLAAAIDRLATK